MMPRLNFGSNNEEGQRYVEDTLTKFATEGLRVLVFGIRLLQPVDYQDFKRKYDEIRTTKSKTRDEDLDKLYDKMEQGLKYIGCTAIEDRL